MERTAVIELTGERLDGTEVPTGVVQVVEVVIVPGLKRC